MNRQELAKNRPPMGEHPDPVPLTLSPEEVGEPTLDELVRRHIHQNLLALARAQESREETQEDNDWDWGESLPLSAHQLRLVEPEEPAPPPAPPPPIEKQGTRDSSDPPTEETGTPLQTAEAGSRS